MFEFCEHPRKKVLEIGCGIGTDASQWAKGSAEYTGVDLTEKAVSVARKRFEIYGYQGESQTADAEDLPFESESFDIVYSFGVLHHTPDTQKAINEVHRVLKPGGRAFIMLYHKARDYYLTQVRFCVLRGELLRMSAQDVLNKYTEVKGNSPLTKCYTRKQADRLFSQFSRREYHVRRLHGPLDKPYFFWLEKIIG
jgi:ubiquinone/menaquinone biosynthesis C-methylase UbiE